MRQRREPDEGASCKKNSATLIARARRCSGTMSKTITVSEIRSKDFTRHGQKNAGRVSVGHHADITPGVSIVLYGEEPHNDYTKREDGTYECTQTVKSYRREFKIGDQAEYDSYNLSYIGTITSITAKTISIVDYKGSSSERTYRLDLHNFDRRNYNLDLKETARRNHETSMCI